MSGLVRWLDRHFEELFAGLTLTIMATLTFSQVITRYFFSKSFSWTDEIAVYCMVWFVYISASWAVRERAHIRVMNLLWVLPDRLSRWMLYLSDAIWLAFAAFLTWQGLVLNASLWKQKYSSPALGIDQKWPYAIIALGFAMMIFRLLQLYWRHIRYGESLTELPAEPREGAPQ